MMMTVQGLGEGTTAAGGEHSTASFYNTTTSNEQHDSFLSSGSSRTEASSPTSSSVSADSDEGVDMTSSPNVFDRKIKDEFFQSKKDVLMAYRRLSLNDDNTIEDDKPIDLSMKTKKSFQIKDNSEVSRSSVLPCLYQLPLIPVSNMGFTLAPGLWHPEMLIKSKVSSNVSKEQTTPNTPLLPIPSIFSTAGGINQIAGRTSFYDTNVFAQFSRLVNAHKSQEQAKHFEEKFREISSRDSSPTNSTSGSYKRKSNKDICHRTSPTGSCQRGSDFNDIETQPNKRPRWQEQSKVFSSLPTYIENSYDGPPTMVPSAYKDARVNGSTVTKEPTLVDFKPCRYPCTECGRTYATIGGLVKHSKSHNDPDSAKTFKCKTCEKEYNSLGALKMHIRTHTLPCKCHICGKAFSRTWLLQGHIRTHTGEKPYQCSICMRSFADRSNLRAHMQTHEAVKRYACTNCDKTYSRISLLNRHQANGGCNQSKTE